MRPALVWALAASLAAATGATLWPIDDDSEGAGRSAGMTAAPQRARPAAKTPVTTDRLPYLPTRAADWPMPGREALASWQGPPPPVAATRLATAPAVPTRSTVPEFPYRWIGQLDEGGAPQQLLASAQRSVGVRLGAVFDGRWRLERDAGGALQAFYLATGDKVAVRGAPAADSP